MTEFAEHLQNALGANYRLDRELTGGGMSRVFVAVDRVLGRNVVVKVLPPELAAGVNRDRFRREIQVAAQLQHPHIVPLLSAGEQGDLLWYTMPYIEGESLRAALERKKQFSAREVTRILHDIVDALAFAHARGVIHRDIKPANILTQGSHALVADFGVAKALSAAMPISSVTSAGIAIGTPAYMAPEQFAGDATADHRMDIYAVGLLAYELVTGMSPFTGPSPRETLAAQLTRDPQPLHEVSPGIPRSLSALIMRCLAKDPAARPQTADEVLHELDSMTMPLGVTPAGGGIEAAKQRWSWKTIAAVVIPVTVLVGVGYLVARRPSPSTAINPRQSRRAQRIQHPHQPLRQPIRQWRLGAPSDASGRETAEAHSSPTRIPSRSPTQFGSMSMRRGPPRLRCQGQARRSDAAKDDGLDHRRVFWRRRPGDRTATDRRRRAARSAKLASGDAARPRRRRQPPADAARAQAAIHRRRPGLRSYYDRENSKRRRNNQGAEFRPHRFDSASAAGARQRDAHAPGLRLRRGEPYRARTAGGKPVPKDEVIYNLDQALLSTRHEPG